ncbi:hypothetical protein PCASD_13013 [Puccinia coronata f. sp. avenae]|uniref:FUN14 domain-containing protein n=1 Tax=Puccinia coronata f. sp. avenae TaxID=200324 RepID=A0A2N5U6J6_9BASI|nr:hypothetical protein PCASD_13013 [Puccinia coronata f. sp. avenae]
MFAVSASRRQLSTSHAPKLMIGSLFQRPRIPTCSSNPVFPNRYHIHEANNSKLNIVHEHSLKSRPDSQRFPLQPSFSSSSKKSTVIILMALMAGCYHQLSPPAAIRLDSEICPGAEPNQFLYNTHQSKQETTPQDIEAEKIHSLLSVRKLSFGTLTGICAGVFVKKGLTFLAFLCGGGFVLLQYLHSSSLIKIDWRNWATRYESRFWSRKDNSLADTSPPAKSILNRCLDFLTHDFQYRSTFTTLPPCHQPSESSGRRGRTTAPRRTAPHPTYPPRKTPPHSDKPSKYSNQTTGYEVPVEEDEPEEDWTGKRGTHLDWFERSNPSYNPPSAGPAPHEQLTRLPPRPPISVLIASLFLTLIVLTA